MDIMQPDSPDVRRSTIDAVLRRMIADREARIAVLQSRIDTLEALLHQREAHAALLETRVATLDRLAGELVWDDAPRAIRSVLPLARLIRRIMRR